MQLPTGVIAVGELDLLLEYLRQRIEDDLEIPVVRRAHHGPVETQVRCAPRASRPGGNAGPRQWFHPGPGRLPSFGARRLPSPSDPLRWPARPPDWRWSPPAPGATRASAPFLRPWAWADRGTAASTTP